MGEHPSTTRPVPPPSPQAALLALVTRFRGWQVEHPHAEYWTATRQRGTEVRVIAAHTPVALYGKLARVEADEAAAPVAPALDAMARYLEYLDQLSRVGTGQ